MSQYCLIYGIHIHCEYQNFQCYLQTSCVKIMISIQQSSKSWYVRMSRCSSIHTPFAFFKMSRCSSIHTPFAFFKCSSQNARGGLNARLHAVFSFLFSKRVIGNINSTRLLPYYFVWKMSKSMSSVSTFEVTGWRIHLIIRCFKKFISKLILMRTKTERRKNRHFTFRINRNQRTCHFKLNVLQN
jgi:hypothetical protein